ncbi:hypothetical protein HPP92_004591 [Vanilla planifolia]|uniref:Uncharacterized protein n=1 Tax=Vanilla planifolia TaxID=51239 RepID=A0A835VCF4_VANPL|nr:hypothetical protein HPP92_004591 [Vanilla planifolia]
MHYPVQSSRITTTKSKLWFTICPPYLDAQRKAVKRIRMLSKNPENRVLIAKFRGIPSRIHLLSYPDLKLQENTVTSLLNLSIDEANKQLITEAGAIPFIIDVLKSGTTEARRTPLRAFFSLSMLDENGNPSLVDLLKDRTMRGEKDAATALFNLCLNWTNKAKAINAGFFKPLLHVLDDRNLGMVDEPLTILFLLSSHPDGRAANG